jgi:outer membrane protein assembly factor BamB
MKTLWIKLPNTGFLKTAILLAVLFFSCQNKGENANLSENITKDTIAPYSEKIEFINPTFLGNFHRNYYGDSIPDNLELNWKLVLGSGKTKVGNDTLHWSGAGWTGQPLMIKEDSVLYLFQGAYDHHLRKIEASSGKVIWKYQFEDVLKGTGTLWKNEKEKDSIELRYLIMQGSRFGFNRSMGSAVVPSYRAVSLVSGENLWQLNVWRTKSYSRDVDASAAWIGDTAYIGLENGRFISFLPDARKAKKKEGIIQPKILDTAELYNQQDFISHKGNLVTEASPAILNNRVYLASGSGHVYGYNLKTKKIDWTFDIGSDIDGSPVVTNDNCLLINVEKEYVKGLGGVIKLNPSKKDSLAVEWYFPVPDRNFATWKGGIIGTSAISDYYQPDSAQQLAAFSTISGKLYVIMHNKLDSGQKVKDFNLQHQYNKPKEIFSYNIGPSISTPLIIPPRIIAAGYNGIYIFEYDKNYQFKLIAKREGGFEATPFVYKGKIYIASRDGHLYCLGK